MSTKVITGRPNFSACRISRMGLAIALRLRHAEVAADILLQGLALAVTDHCHRTVPQHGNAAHNGTIVHAGTVAPLLKEVGEQVRRYSPEYWAGPGNAGQLHPLIGTALCISHFCAPPRSCSRSRRISTPRISLRGTTSSTKPHSCRNSARWNPSGSFCPMVCSITRGPAKPMSAFGSARMISPSDGKAGCHAAGGGIGQHGDIKTARLAEPLHGCAKSWPSASGR